MFSLAFVCSGNICRSPLAHAIFEKMAGEKSLICRVDSFGLHDYHKGELPDPRTRKNAQAHGYDAQHRSQKVSRKLMLDFDLILAMDHGHVSSLHSLYPELVPKIRLYRSFEPQQELQNYDVPDPYYGDSEDFEKVFRIIERVTPHIISYIERL